MATPSNVNLNTALNTGNTGTAKSSVNRSIPTAVVMVPAGTVVPPSALVSQSAFATYINAKFIADDRTTRWFALQNLDKFTDATKAKSTEDTGIYQFDVFKFSPKFSFRYMMNFSNFVEALQFNGCQGFYDYFFFDASGNFIGAKDIAGGTQGMRAITNAQMFVEDMGFHTTTNDNMYMFTTTCADRSQLNENSAIYQANYPVGGITMLQNANLFDVSDIVVPAAPTTTISFTIKSGQDSYDVVKNYLSSLTAACFVATNLTVGGTAISATPSSITTGSSVVSGQTIYWVKSVLSAAPTAGNIVRIALAAPSVVNAIITGLNLESLANNNVNGANCCIHTF